MLQRLPSRRPVLPWLRGASPRGVLVRLHRYAGLALALFLAFAGLTGSAIVFGEELDAFLNPALFHTGSKGPVLPPTQLARRVEHALPGARVTYIPLRRKGDETYVLGVTSKPGVTLAYDEVFTDPVTGRVLATRQWGQCSLSRLHLMPFLYVAHYTLQLPGTWGVLFMGIVGILWTIDCFIGFALTLPRGKPFWRKWATSWRIKPNAGRYRFHLDLHRAGSLWFAFDRAAKIDTAAAAKMLAGVARSVSQIESPRGTFVRVITNEPDLNPSMRRDGFAWIFDFRRQPLMPQRAEPTALLRQTCALLERSLREDITIVMQIADGLPMVEVDAGAFELAILNVSLNARDAMPKGGTLAIAARRETLHTPPLELEGEYVAISVSDTGTGIPAELLPRVVEPFFTTKEVGKGSGLGLSQAYGLARQSGGNMVIESELGRGTTVTFYLPAR